MDSTKQIEIVDGLRRAAQMYDLDGNPWEADPPKPRHFEMMMFVHDVEAAAFPGAFGRLSTAEKNWLHERATALVTTSSYYRNMMGEVDAYQAEFKKPAEEKAAAIVKRRSSR